MSVCIAVNFEPGKGERGGRGGGQVRKRKRRNDRDAEARIAVQVPAVDRCLERFFNELAECELKLADYMRLTELETMVAGDGDGEVIVQWISCENVQ